MGRGRGDQPGYVMSTVVFKTVCFVISFRWLTQPVCSESVISFCLLTLCSVVSFCLLTGTVPSLVSRYRRVPCFRERLRLGEAAG